jgi:hypothetical protein
MGPDDRIQPFIDRLHRQGLRPEVLPVDDRAPNGRNAAIRRARGEFVLVTDARVMFSDELVQFLAAGRLEKHRLYRIDRYDVASAGGPAMRVHAREGTFPLTLDGFRRNEARDIAAVESGVYFGGGWFPAEYTAAGAAFRWMENDGEVFLRLPSGGRVIALEFEPGPGIAETPAVLQVVDGTDTQVAEWRVTGRIRVELAVPPPRSGDLQRLRMHVRGGGLPVADDPRILNLRFFRCDWVEREAASVPHRPLTDIVRENWPTLARLLTSMRASAGSLATVRRGPRQFQAAARLLGARGSDIFAAGEEIRFGHGWHGLEESAGERFRWAAQNAQLLLRITRMNYQLSLLVEPGPGLGNQPFTLIVRDGAQAEIARRRISGLTWVQFPVPLPDGAVAKLIFAVEGEGAPTDADPRVLNFRVLACGGESGSTPAQRMDIHACWPYLRIDEQPVEIDRSPRLDMGMPVFLHTNASGDFTLMSRDDWQEVRGYPELEAPPDRLETLLCYTAHFAGAQEEILREPMRISRVEDAGEPEWKGASCLSAAELQELIAQMRTMRAPVIYNAIAPRTTRAEGDPYLSVVIAARNDNHGGNMLRRMQAFFDAWLGHSKRYAVSSEIVVVEWNPPPDRPRLIDAIEWPSDPHPCRVRFVEVPAETHRRFPHPDTVPLHQMIAKNAGIRRARGEFVLATNLDIVFSAELMRYLAARRLEPRHMYRLDRYDVASDIPARAGVDELLAFCQSHRLRVFTGEGDFNLGDCGLRDLEKKDIVAPDAGIRFGPGWYAVEAYEAGPFRWIAAEAEILFAQAPRGRLAIDVDNGPSCGGAGVGIEIVSPDGAVLGSGTVKGRCRVLVEVSDPIAAGFRLRVLGGGVPLTHDLRMLNLRVFGLQWAVDSGGPRVQMAQTGPAKDWSSFVQAPSPYAAHMRDAAYLHTNACGDFTLLARDDWFALRGYPEFPIWPMHIDALLCYAAHHAGMREVILADPMRVFHIEHLSGAGWTPEGEQERRARIAAKGVPAMEYSEFEKWVHRMRRFSAPIIVTRDDWGLGDAALPETAVNPMGYTFP